MNKNSRNQDSSDDEYLLDIKKTTYWELYGVKRFPYRGKRKFTPLLSESLDGGMVISNDVFGLTICQFERMYNACLERRKTKEQWILNLRYPDKSSKEYLEYLENCSDCNKDNIPCIESYLSEKYLYEHLVQTVGTEIDIRTRQRLFIIHDMIINACVPDPTQISSGSLAEGFDLPGSDIDVMNVVNDLAIVQNVRNIKHPISCTTLVLETDIDHPGFTRLRVNTVGETSRVYCQSYPGTCTHEVLYLPANTFLDEYKNINWNVPVFLHGPCLSDRGQTFDIAYCLRSKHLPQNANPWFTRHRSQWPPNFVIDRIIHYGCLLVPTGPKTISDNGLFWRLSFSVAEKILIHSFNFTQLLCYGLLKLTLKRIVNTHDDVKNLLCSYFLKTALFWVSEEVDIDTFKLSKIHYCFSLCLDKLIAWVKTCYCPNYFIPEHNMFLGKINQFNNNILLCVLESIMFGGIDALINNLFAPNNEYHQLFRTKNESMEFLFKRIMIPVCWENWMVLPKGILSYYKGLATAEFLSKSETSTFIIDICKYYYARISQVIAQKLPSPKIKDNIYNIRKCYLRHLKDGIKADDVCGWLLYASYYYVTRQFNVTLRLTDYVLSRCSPGMISLSMEQCLNSHYQKLHSTMTSDEKMTTAYVEEVNYVVNSSLVPEELHLEGKGHVMSIPSVVMSHFLRFLCFHHLNDISNRRQTLWDLNLIVNTETFSSNSLFKISLSILGVCNEISGYKDEAYKCYNLASLYASCKCAVAEKRKLKLFDI